MHNYLYNEKSKPVHADLVRYNENNCVYPGEYFTGKNNSWGWDTSAYEYVPYGNLNEYFPHYLSFGEPDA